MDSKKNDKVYIAPLTSYNPTEVESEESGKNNPDLSQKSDQDIIEKIFKRNGEKSKRATVSLNKKLHDRLQLLKLSIDDDIPLADIVSNIVEIHLNDYNDVYAKAIKKHIRNTME